MPATPIAAVKILSVPREGLSHDSGNTLLTAFEEEMEMIVHEHPGVDGTSPLDDVLAEPLNEQGFVLVIFEDVGFIYPANHDVVQGARDVQPGLTWHRATLSDFPGDVKCYAT